MPDSNSISIVRGRPFAKGNAGRPAGSKNRSTLIAAELLEREIEPLVQKALEMARNGDAQMMKFLLSRLLPRDRTVQLSLPDFDHADDAVAVMAAILRAVGEGQISPSEGAALAAVIKESREAIDLVEAVKPIDALKQKIE